MSAPDVWGELVGAALLGTDRRDPPVLPSGPLADLVADAVLPDPAARLLAAVAGVTAARRAAFVPLAPVAALHPPPDDARPLVPATAASTWREVVADWPVLEDEWMLAVVARRWRLPPDVLVEALARHRTDPVRRARTALAGGPLAAWVTEHVPSLAPSGNRTVPAEAVAAVPDLPVAPELADLLGADALTFVRGVLAHLDPATAAQRPMFVNLLARCRPAVLVDAADALAQHRSTLAYPLARLARLRARMLTELDPSTPVG